MHEDYKTRLTTLCDKLTDVVLTESDPDNWPGADKAINELSKDERGDRYWDKKNAAASLTLLIKVHSLIGMHNRGGKTPDNSPSADTEEEMAKEVATAERDAKRVVERALKKAKCGQ
ncbi:TPA: hypothetical protein PXJ75_002865 [Yersinia enterocolitica]|nr:hypothetical protein [Yersinia enterocolitica]CQH34491.1 Uncharacterised protein [Yersinia enterocolitica]HDL6769219.1 hypothetical protein [Yersinia enterocolitica]HDL7723239.1 hypothetical protein [Yersinia enterocolitica]